jgi:hypothetical protein
MDPADQRTGLQNYDAGRRSRAISSNKKRRTAATLGTPRAMRRLIIQNSSRGIESRLDAKFRTQFC